MTHALNTLVSAQFVTSRNAGQPDSILESEYFNESVLNVQLAAADGAYFTAERLAQMSINDKIYALRAKTELDPIAQFSFEATDLSVDFTNESVDPNNYPLTYVWDFGDTNTSTEADPTHVYDAADTYDVRLTATNSKGIENSVIQSVTVTEPAP